MTSCERVKGAVCVHKAVPQKASELYWVCPESDRILKLCIPGHLFSDISTSIHSSYTEGVLSEANGKNLCSGNDCHVPPC